MVEIARLLAEASDRGAERSFRPRDQVQATRIDSNGNAMRAAAAAAADRFLLTLKECPVCLAAAGERCVRLPAPGATSITTSISHAYVAPHPERVATPEAAKARTASIPAKYKVKKHSGVRTRPAICLTLSDDDIRRLDVVARAEGVSRSRLISSLSRFCFERHFGKVTTLDAAEAEYPEDES